MSCVQGSFPSALVSAPHLFALQIYNNNLSGSLPDQQGMLPFLMSFRLGNNSLEGKIPESLGGISFFNHQVCTDGCMLSSSMPVLYVGMPGLISLCSFVENKVQCFFDKAVFDSFDSTNWRSPITDCFWHMEGSCSLNTVC